MAILFVRLEKEYTTIKNKEMEEQVEIKVSDKLIPPTIMNIELYGGIRNEPFSGPETIFEVCTMNYCL